MTAITNTSDRAAEHLGEAVSHAKRVFLAQIGKTLDGAREAEGRGIDALLDRLGLQRRESALRPAFWFATGAVAAGAMVALLMSTTSGKEVRRRIATFLGAKTDAGALRVEAVEPQAGRDASSAGPMDGAGARHEAG
jgi:hypothetical protein